MILIRPSPATTSKRMAKPTEAEVYGLACQELAKHLTALILGAGLATAEVRFSPLEAATRLINMADNIQRLSTHTKQLAHDVVAWAQREQKRKTDGG